MWFKKKSTEPDPVIQIPYHDSILSKLSIEPKIDTDSPTWAAIVEAVKKERQELLELNGRVGRTDKERDVTAGEISNCDWVLRLPNVKKLEW